MKRLIEKLRAFLGLGPSPCSAAVCSKFCAEVICVETEMAGGTKATITIEGLEYEGKPMGNWVVTAIKQNSKDM